MLEDFLWFLWLTIEYRQHSLRKLDPEKKFKKELLLTKRTKEFNVTGIVNLKVNRKNPN
jgi:hypothetical protein